MKSLIKYGSLIIFILSFFFSDALSKSPSKKSTKISSALSNSITTSLTEQQSLGRSESSIPLAVSSSSIDYDEKGMAQVYITLYELTQQNLEELKNAGVVIEIYDKLQNLVQARVYPDQIEMVTELPFVKFIDLPNYGYTNAGSVQTEGDAVLNADDVRNTFGVDGTGVKVGVISDGIYELTGSVGSGDLPASGVQIPSSPLTGGGISIDAPCPGFIPVTTTPVGRPDLTTGEEGTAMLEIIHDVTPGAELFFAPGLSSELGHRRATRCLAEVVNIIADDIAFFNSGSYDGSSPVSLESTASVLVGVANFISVGNQALVHYQGVFTDTDGDTLHEFDGSLGLPFSNNSGETLNITIPPGGSIGVVLQWDDPFGASGNDYDLALVFPPDDPTAIIFVSANFQDGDDNPTEEIFVTNIGMTPITVGILLVNFLGAASPKEFDMFVVGDIFSLDEFVVVESSVPNNADADLVLSIGSIGLGPGDPLGQGIDQIRVFSSAGPTNDGRLKPELVAPDGVTTTVPGFAPFFGTSAAAPHAAGVAALLLDAASRVGVTSSTVASVFTLQASLTPNEIEDILETSAVDLGSPGADNTFGFGRIDAFAAVQQVLPEITVIPTSLDFGTVTEGSSSNLTITLQNEGQGELQVTNVEITGTGASAFSNDATPPFTLTSGQSQDINVTFSPPAVGTFDATLTITNNDLDEGIIDILLTGIGEEKKGGGGCFIAGPSPPAGTTVVNILVLLSPAFIIGFGGLRRFRKKKK